MTKDIANILNISEKSVRKYKKEVKNNVGSDKIIKPVKRNRKRRVRDPGININKERGGESSISTPDINTHGEESIIFIGGQKSMVKKIGSETKEEKDQFQCYKCGYIQDTIFKNCPKCNTENIFEE